MMTLKFNLVGVTLDEWRPESWAAYSQKKILRWVKAPAKVGH
jgi:hypothetical protein